MWQKNRSQKCFLHNFLAIKLYDTCSFQYKICRFWENHKIYISLYAYIWPTNCPNGPQIGMQTRFMDTYDAFRGLGVILVSQGSKIENLVDRSNGLILPIFTLGRSFKAKFMQMKSFECNFVFLHMYLYCKKYLKIADFGHFRQLFFGKKNYLEKYFRTTLQNGIDWSPICGD